MCSRCLSIEPFVLIDPIDSIKGELSHDQVCQEEEEEDDEEEDEEVEEEDMPIETNKSW